MVASGIDCEKECERLCALRELSEANSPLASSAEAVSEVFTTVYEERMRAGRTASGHKEPLEFASPEIGSITVHLKKAFHGGLFGRVLEEEPQIMKAAYECAKVRCLGDCALRNSESE